jgi:hypothetical protein
MSQRQQLATMVSMLEYVADAARDGGFILVATLSAAAAEAAHEEINDLRRSDTPRTATGKASASRSLTL